MSDQWEPYSVRQRRKEQAGSPVVYQPDHIPELFRAQAMYGIRLATRAVDYREIDGYWASLGAHVAAEHGLIRETSPQ